MKKTLLLSLLMPLCIGLSAQQNYDLSIEASFEIYKKAVLDVDRITLANMEHPNIVKMGGGSIYYMDELTQEYNMYSASGLAIKDLRINESSKVIRAEDDLQAMVPYVRSLDTGTEIINEENFFLVTSQDGGKNWFFTDMKKHSSESIKVFIPNYNERLNIYVNSITH